MVTIRTLHVCRALPLARTALAITAAALLLTPVGCRRAEDPAAATPAAKQTAQQDAPAPAEPTEPSPAADVEANRNPPANPQQARGPHLQFDALTHDFGTMSETETRSTKLKFRNTGTEPLRINDITTTCGCTVAKKPTKPFYMPGETGAIDIVFDPSGPNPPGKPQKKYVSVMSNSVPNRVTQITVTADVTAFIDLDPRFVDLGVLEQGVAHHADVTVTCPDPMFIIDAVDTTNPNVQATVLEESAQRESGEDDGTSTTRTIRITVPADAPWGALFSWLQVTVTGRPSPMAEPLTHSSRIRVQGQIFGDLAADPDTFRFGVQRGESFERTITLTHRDGEPFNITGVETDCALLARIDVQPRRLTGAQWELVMTAAAGNVAGQAEGVVTVHTDLTGSENTIDLPISGVVRAKAPTLGK